MQGFGFPLIFGLGLTFLLSLLQILCAFRILTYQTSFSKPSDKILNSQLFSRSASVYKSHYANTLHATSAETTTANQENGRDSVGAPIPQIFCNVELNGEYIEAVGFDMDFTLAQYNEEFDLLAFEGAKRKLYENLHYPREVLEFEYSSTMFTRGLVIDKQRGNILKVDRHKYVRRAQHGLAELSTLERKGIYTNQVATFTEKNYVNIDTIFLLIDALLFAHLVELRKSIPSMQSISYEQLYKDVRTSVDICHRDGVIKGNVMQDPARYIIYDEDMVPMLKQLRQAGKKTFLLTNSLFDYTDEVMRFLVHGRGENKDVAHWRDLFDISIVGGCKPAFLTNEAMSMFRLDEEGDLSNIEDRDGLVPATEATLHPLRLYQGGCWLDLHRLLQVSSGDKVLYVGDHMFSDILRSKRTLGWRTCLIIPELDNELLIARNAEDTATEVLRLRQLQHDLDEFQDLLRLRIRMGAEHLQEQLNEAESKASEIKQTARMAMNDYNSRFNPTWGQLFKAGHSDSRFAKQVRDYACLYTSKASNLVRVSPNRRFRPVEYFMPHDQALVDLEYVYDIGNSIP